MCVRRSTSWNKNRKSFPVSTRKQLRRPIIAMVIDIAIPRQQWVPVAKGVESRALKYHKPFGRYQGPLGAVWSWGHRVYLEHPCPILCQLLASFQLQPTFKTEQCSSREAPLEKRSYEWYFPETDGALASRDDWRGQGARWQEE